MADVVGATLTYEHVVEIAETDGTVVFEIITLLAFLWQEITTFNVFEFILSL